MFGCNQPRVRTRKLRSGQHVLFLRLEHHKKIGVGAPIELGTPSTIPQPVETHFFGVSPAGFECHR